MRTALICTAQPASFVSLTDAKTQLGIAASDSSKNAFLTSLIEASCDYLDGADGTLKRAVSQQSWKLVLPSFHPKSFSFPYRIELPLPPIRSVDSIKYFDGAGSEVTLDGSKWRLVNKGSERSCIVPIGIWPPTQCRDDAVSIAFTAGYGTGEGQERMPKQIRQAVILMVKQLHDMGARNAFLASEETEGVGSRSYFAEGAVNVIEKIVDNLLFNIRIRD